VTIRIIKNYKSNKSSTFESLLKKLFSEKVKDKDFAKKLYDCLCNTIWYNKITNDIYSCSWRYAGGFVAGLRNEGEDYLDFYCQGFSHEGDYHSEIYEELSKLGFKALQYNKITCLQKHEFKGRL